MDKISNTYQQNLTPVKNLNSEPRSNGEFDSNRSFINEIKDTLDKVSEEQLNAQKIAKAFEVGEENSVAKVMVAQQVSSLGFNMVLNVRNKVLSAYRDIINMPV
ncbi:MAG: flagellar hook-basal body complex protein FliE [Rhodospirillaceae bacterium]|nr:flagellar hook-basal body complex protein FliE [Rhodospirillaceae bacterium]|tara:strand:+ start:3056 stop:3367 length:312 start_codon:yes stop_codon:yes gene_type:complete